jgi:outer membrane murein-binding lipoprotein Lpp
VSSVAREEDQHTRAVDLGPVAGDRLDDLRSELVDLRSEIAELRRDMDELRESLGG